MKTIIIGIIFIVTFAALYLILSLFGALFVPYSKVISTPEWFVMYTVFVGWWGASFPAREYYIRHEEYFERI